jgi:hypothetical protein
MKIDKVKFDKVIARLEESIQASELAIDRIRGINEARVAIDEYRLENLKEIYQLLLSAKIE